MKIPREPKKGVHLRMGGMDGWMDVDGSPGPRGVHIVVNTFIHQSQRSDKQIWRRRQLGGSLRFEATSFRENTDIPAHPHTHESRVNRS